MKRAELDRVLTTKLRMQKEAGGRHTNYILRIGGKLVLPRTVRLSHGSGELRDREKGSTARDLFLKERELDTCVQCYIDAECVFLCIAISLLTRLAEMDPEATPRGELLRDCAGIGDLLLAAESFSTTRPQSLPSRAVLERLEASLDLCMNTQHTRELARRIQRHVLARC